MKKINQQTQKNKILDTSAETISLKWHELLIAQTELFIPFELSLLYGCYDWGSSNNILDIGCGNGYFTKKISDHFPEKQFTAIDISSELISSAQQHNASPRINYIQGDLFEFETIEPYDCIIMRLIVQHLGDFNKILDQVQKLLIPGGSLIILDADHQNMFNFPKLPKFYALLLQLEKLSEDNNTNRCLSHRLSNVVEQSKGWYLEEEEHQNIPFMKAGSNYNILRVYDLWLDIIEAANEVSANFDEIRAEIAEWRKSPYAFAQFGIHFMHLVKSDKNRHLVYI